ncbi:sigma-70 family RNA polymerase sigma factor [Methylobacterium sp. CCH5-D2]|uniref:sigma-70 family RNA polymerase sigma factor n=1 Tax=Methylobacterium sp. CCH5-D2 TaxID=1768765 RepID=UPI00083358DC|nr:sigma-70 family RNA polymerase sigma factor [Methylobacterium sp. CCH5-D2]
MIEISHDEQGAAEIPALPDAVRQHLGQLLAAAYDQPESEPEPPERFSALLAQLDCALAGVADRDAEVFRSGLLAAVPTLRRFARSLGCDHAAADDVVQDVVLRAWRSQSSFRPGTNLEAWLFTITRNQFYSLTRKQGREVEDVDGEFTNRLATAPEQTGCADLQDVRTALARLPTAMRETLMLVAVEGMSHEQVAEVMGCQVGTVKSRVFRARERLVALLGYDGNDIGADRLTLSAMSGQPD